MFTKRFSLESGKKAGLNSEDVNGAASAPTSRFTVLKEARPLEVLDWGCLDYGQALRRQRTLVEDRIADRTPDRLILVEHPPVVTVGRSGGPSDLRVSREALERAGIELYEVERGGQATYHGPGQLVAYPIIKLRVKDLHQYLGLLLKTTACLLDSYGLKPEMKTGRPGLWVEGAKIASVGMAARSWVTYHGLALNVNTNLDGFNHIIPCGRPEEQVTSLKQILGRPIDMEAVKKKFVAEFFDNFDYQSTGIEETLASGHPGWLVRPAQDFAAIERMETKLSERALATVCQNAQCPNLGECFQQGTATFMILGSRCTRRCRFCAVDKGWPETLDPDEPRRVALTARDLGLRHVVVTSVTRDDLPEGGAGHFAETITQLRAACPGAAVEVLVPDFQGSAEALEQVVAARPDVFNHNLETVARLYGSVRPEAGYRRSLEILRYAANHGLTVKSGLMLGLGETSLEIRETLRDLKQSGCRLLTLGQYLSPSQNHWPVARYLSPAEFESWRREALALGFAGVASAPLVRSSYLAEVMWSSSMKIQNEEYNGQKKIYSRIGHRG
jgi:lipoic acid synthetase